jgi:hypothetical protein
MLATVLMLVLGLAAIALVLFVALVVGMRNEPSYDELSARPPGRLASLTRRMLGVSVRKPATDRALADIGTPAEPWFAGVGYTPSSNDEDR